MVETWKVQTEFSDGQETNARGFIFRGVFGIKNDSPDTVEVREIFIEPRYGGKVVGVGPYTVERVTAFSGGDPMLFVKHDTGSADLPAQVSAVTNPDSLTRTDLFRRQGELPGVLATSAGAGLGLVKNQHIGDPWNHVIGFRRAQPVNSVQKIVLREGQGVVWFQLESTVSNQQWGSIGVVNQASGENYTVFSSRITQRAEQAGMMLIFNGAGSGVILEVEVIEAINAGRIGTSSSFLFPVGLRIMRADDLSDGEVLVPVAYDTGNVALPSGMVFLRDPLVVADRSTPVDYPYLAMESPALAGTWAAGPVMALQRLGLIRGAHHDALAITNQATPFSMLMQNRRRILGGRGPLAGDLSALMVKPRERVAVAWGYAPNFEQPLIAPVNDFWFSTASNFDVSCEFNVIPAPPSGAGGVSKNRIIGGL